MFDIDLRQLKIEHLRDLYEKEMIRFEQALLEGKRWEDLREQRIVVTRLTQAIHRHYEQHASRGPAENAERSRFA